MAQVVGIRVTKMYESCQRTTYFVELRTDEGSTKTPESFQTGSVYTDFKGLSIEEARDRALIEATSWGNFLNIVVDTYEEDGVTHAPSMVIDSYEMQREELKLSVDQRP